MHFNDQCVKFNSGHHVHWHNRLLEEDRQERGRQSLLQGSLVQRDPRHGRCLRLGALRRDQEVHINIHNSIGNPSPHVLIGSYNDNSLGELSGVYVYSIEPAQELVASYPSRQCIWSSEQRTDSETCIYLTQDVQKKHLQAYQLTVKLVQKSFFSIELHAYCKQIASTFLSSFSHSKQNECTLHSNCCLPRTLCSCVVYLMCPTINIILIRIKMKNTY